MESFRKASILGVALAIAGVACGDSGTGGAGGNGATSGTTTATSTGGGSPSGVSIPGLSAPVTAAYDQNGLLHLTCASDDDCFAALGYFHASNRFFFMDFVRNLVRGSLGGLVKAGDVVLQNDYANRRFFTTRQGDPLEKALYDAASPEVKGHLDAYTKGVNAWIGDMHAGRNGATLTSEYDFPLIVKEAIRDWEPEDSAAIGLYVLNDLSNNSDTELALAEQAPAFPPALAADLFTTKPVFDAYTLPAATMFNGAPPPFSDEAAARLLPERFMIDDARATMDRVGATAARLPSGEIGSNDWVVGPSRTASGSALLANDPHLQLTNPSIWFGVELDAKSSGTGVYHVAGSTFPGLPSVMVGHNESIGWGVTTAYYDLADEYVEELTPDGKGVVFNGQTVPLIEKDYTFQDAKSGMSVTKTFQWVPHHGPIVSEDLAAGTAMSIRWTGHEGGTDLDAFFAVARAGSVDEAKEGLAFASSANQNFVIVDKAGNIGWFPYSKVPSRPWASPSLPASMPLPGDGSAEWDGFVPFAALPQVENPANGIVATANNDMTGASQDGDVTNDNQPAIQAWDKAEGTREQRILDLLAAGGNAHTVQSMHDMQGDTYSLYGSFVVPAVKAAAMGATLSPDEQAVVDALSNWQFTCPTGLDGSDPMASPKTADATVAGESIGCSAFHVTLFAIVHEALGDEAAAAGVDLSSTRVDLHMVARYLHDPTSVSSGALFWDDVSTTGTVETETDIIRRAITDAAAALAPLGGPDEWRWGRIHTLTLRSIFDSFGIGTYNAGPYAAPGGQYTVNVANPISRALPMMGMPPDMAFSAGPSVRFVVEASSAGVTMSYELPGGADLHHDSPFYNNLLPNWLVNQPIDFPFGPGAVPMPAKVVQVSPAP